MDQAAFPWRTLGKLLVDEELLTPTELERALGEQRESGRLLGQILVEQGAMTGVELAQALARQHGVEVEAGGTAEVVTTRLEDAPSARWKRPWRPLGAVLVDNGLVSEADLRDALEEKRVHQDRRLGEILVRRGHLTAAGLALALAEQHGVRLESSMQAVAAPSPVHQGPTYRVFEVGYASNGGARAVLYESPNLLDAADFALDYVDREEPQAIEIERGEGPSAETVWTYSRDRAVAEDASSKRLVDTFGFDPTLWGANS
jgi:hypothetical protein